MQGGAAADTLTGGRSPRNRLFGGPNNDTLHAVTGDTLYGETTVLDKRESTSKDDRGVVHVETIGYNQDGTVVCIFRRKVMVPKQSYLDARGGEQPGRPVPERP